jgi:hypothetical protein
LLPTTTPSTIFLNLHILAHTKTTLLEQQNSVLLCA